MERLQLAASFTQERGNYHTCIWRGQKIGERPCPTCDPKKNVRLNVYWCGRIAWGVTIPECEKCDKPLPVVGTENDLSNKFQEKLRACGSRLVLTNWQSPGDVVMLTAAVRDLHKMYPNRFQTDLRTSCDAIWQNNPYVTRFPETWIDEEASLARDKSQVRHREGVTIIPCAYAVQRGTHHFLEAFHETLSGVLGLPVPITEWKGDVHISDQEKRWINQVAEMGVWEPFWLINTGGKWDYTIKWMNPNTLQAAVNHFMGKVIFVQVGDAGNWQPALTNVIDLVGRTDLRQLIMLIYHAQGVITGVNGLMHLAAAIPTPNGKPRPCVVYASGQESPHWEAYPGHRFLHNNGALACSGPLGCWRSRCQAVGDKDAKDTDEARCQNFVEVDSPESPLCRTPVSKVRIPKCLNMISPEHMIAAIQDYFDGGALTWLT